MVLFKTLLPWLLAIVATVAAVYFSRRKPARVETSETLLESLYAGLGDACLLLSESTEILYANEGAPTLFGSTLSLQGKRLSQIMPDPKVNEFIARAFKLSEGSLEDEFSITVHPRGRTEDRYFVFNAAPVQVMESGPRQVRLVVRDETRRQETEQIRRDFVANASHELRTPLAIINGYLENLADGAISEPAQIQRAVTVMLKNGERLAHLVDDMLIISKFEAHEDHESATLENDSFSCRECVEGVLERLAPLFEQIHAKAVVEIPPDDILPGDQFYWDQVFFNLIENALKENREISGLVITISMERAGHQTHLRIRDNGKGIPHEHLPFIFKRFYRVNKDHSQQKTKGTGLGLSIVKRAVEAHGGTISVESSLGMRTEFHIILENKTPEGIAESKPNSA